MPSTRSRRLTTWSCLICYFFAMPAPWARAETALPEPPPAKASSADPKLLRWIRGNVSPVTAMPFSFYIPPEDKKALYSHIGKPGSVTGIIERLILEEGISVYDAAVWQITLTLLGGQEDLKLSSLPTDVYWRGSLKSLYSLWARTEEQTFSYRPAETKEENAGQTHPGPRGFLFRIINANGSYLMADPQDNKKYFEQFPNYPDIHWEDWKPIAGENAWVAMAALHLYHKKYYRPGPDPYDESSGEAIELLLAKEIAESAILLQAECGGVRMAPLGTYYHLIDLGKEDSVEEISRKLDDHSAEVKRAGPLPQAATRAVGNKLYPEYHIWYYEEISTENNLSWYAAFRMLFQITRDQRYKLAMDNIEGYMKKAWDAEDHYFYQGMHKTNGEWHPNTEFFATDVQNWAIVVLGPQKLDEWFGDGTAYRIWQVTKELSGATDQAGELLGVGFSEENDRISVEWTAGSILATSVLKDYYRASHPAWAAEAAREAQTMRQGMEAYRKDLPEDKAAYAYSSRRGWIPFGWFSLDPYVLSLVSTCWILIADPGLDPFVLAQN